MIFTTSSEASPEIILVKVNQRRYNFFRFFSVVAGAVLILIVGHTDTSVGTRQNFSHLQGTYQIQDTGRSQVRENLRHNPENEGNSWLSVQRKNFEVLK